MVHKQYYSLYFLCFVMRVRFVATEKLSTEGLDDCIAKCNVWLPGGPITNITMYHYLSLILIFMKIFRKS